MRYIVRNLEAIYMNVWPEGDLSMHITVIL